MYFMVTASELVTLFLGIELIRHCFYVLVGFTRRDRRSNEAALKYLLLGGSRPVFSSTDSRCFMALPGPLNWLPSPRRPPSVGPPTSS